MSDVEKAGLARHVARSLRWSNGAVAASILLQLGSTALLARLVDPAAYGVLAFANAVLNLLVLLGDLGITSIAIRVAGLAVERFWAMLWLGVGVNSAIMLLVWLAAPLAARMADLPGEAADVLRLTALTLPLHGLANGVTAWMRRDLRFRSLAVQSLAAQAFGVGVVTVPMALTGYGVWALAAGSLAQVGVALALALRHVSPTMPGRQDWTGIVALLRLGGGFSLLRLTDAALAQLPVLALAALVGADAAGVYNRACVLTMVLFELGMGMAGRVLMPAYGRLGTSADGRLGRAFLSVARMVPALFFPVAAGMAAAAPQLVRVMLGEAWLSVVPVLPLMAGWGCIRVLSILCGGLIEARGNLLMHVAQRLMVLAGLVGWLALVRPAGLSAVLAAVIVAEGVSVLFMALLAAHAAAVPALRLWSAMLQGGTLALPVGLAVHLAGRWLSGLTPAILAGMMALSVAMALFPGRALRQSIAQHLMGEVLGIPDQGKTPLAWLRRWLGRP